MSESGNSPNRINIHTPNLKFNHSKPLQIQSYQHFNPLSKPLFIPMHKCINTHERTRTRIYTHTHTRTNIIYYASNRPKITVYSSFIHSSFLTLCLPSIILRSLSLKASRLLTAFTYYHTYHAYIYSTMHIQCILNHLLPYIYHALPILE